jgi:hypothetical protein
MDPVNTSTEYGTPVGTVGGVVHLLSQISGLRTYGLCRRVLRGELIDRTGDEPTCQRCIDARDKAAARAAGFAHQVSVRRIPLGHSPVAGSTAMRYGAEVRCLKHLDERGRPTVIWTTNESGQLDKARKIADQHYLTAYREHLG